MIILSGITIACMGGVGSTCRPQAELAGGDRLAVPFVAEEGQRREEARISSSAALRAARIVLPVAGAVILARARWRKK